MDCRVSPLKETLNLLHYLKISSKQGPRASDFYETSCMQLATLGSHLLLFFCGDYVKEIASLPQLFPAFPSPSKLRERGKKRKRKIMLVWRSGLISQVRTEKLEHQSCQKRKDFFPCSKENERLFQSLLLWENPLFFFLLLLLRLTSSLLLQPSLCNFLT